MLVPMKTKKSPRTIERAMIVTAPRDAVGSPRQVPTNPSALFNLAVKVQAVSTGKARDSREGAAEIE